MLTPPEPGAAISLAVDASNSHVEATETPWLLVPLAFYSRKLSATLSKYSTFNRELLASYSAVRHFHFLLEGREFSLFTDHKPLMHALFCSTPPWSSRQQRNLDYIDEFTRGIVHIPGAEDAAADALSKPTSADSIPAVSTPSMLFFFVVDLELSSSSFDFSSLLALQSACPSVQSMISSPFLSNISVPFFHPL